MPAATICRWKLSVSEMKTRYSVRWHYAANAPRNIYSHTKSFTVTAVGLAIEEGKLSLEDHVAEVFKDKLPSNPDPNLEKIQLKHLLCMSSGFGKALLMNADRRPGVGAPDYEKYMMAQPVPVEPGSAFCYSSADSILAAHMVERAVGKRMGEYLYEKVFQPLDMGWPLWEHDPQGHPNGGGGMYLTCTEMMKLGQLYLAEGNWKGEQIVSRDWVQEVSTPKFTFEPSADLWHVDMAISSGSVHIQDPIVLMAHSDRLQRFSQRRDWLFPSNVRSKVISIR